MVCAGVLLSASCLPTDPQYRDSAITEHWVPVYAEGGRNSAPPVPPLRFLLLFFPDEKRCNYISAC